MPFRNPQDQNQNPTEPTQTPAPTDTQQTPTPEQAAQTPSPTGQTSSPSTSQPFQGENSFALMRQLLQEKERQIQQLQQQQQQPQQPQKSADELKQEFYNNPVAVIQNEVRNAIAPLNDFMLQFRQQDEYSRIKNNYRNNPQFAQIFPSIEPLLDQAMQGAPVNDANVRTAIFSILGAAQVGLVQLSGQQHQQQMQQAQQPVPANNQPPVNPVVTPPHLRPSAPQAPVPQQNQTQVRQLTELERRLARENNMSDAEFLQHLYAQPNEILSLNPAKK